MKIELISIKGNKIIVDTRLKEIITENQPSYQEIYNTIIDGWDNNEHLSKFDFPYLYSVGVNGVPYVENGWMII